jgi:hypothetical protein
MSFSSKKKKKKKKEKKNQLEREKKRERKKSWRRVIFVCLFVCSLLTSVAGTLEAFDRFQSNDEGPVRKASSLVYPNIPHSLSLLDPSLYVHALIPIIAHSRSCTAFIGQDDVLFSFVRNEDLCK